MRSLVSVGIWLFSMAGTAQELVLNGGFELYHRCPSHFARRPAAQLRHVQVLAGMPGFFHACGRAMGAPDNWAGTQAPAGGEGYAGLVLTAHGGGECAARELLQLELAEPLRNGGKYHVSFQVSTADRTGYVTDRIGVAFTTDRRRPKQGLTGLIGRAAVENEPGRFLSDTSGWATVEGIYDAQGGERHIIIGNLHGCDRTSRKALTPNTGEGTAHNMRKRAALELGLDKDLALRRRMLATQAYVYIDQVSVRPVEGFTGATVLDPATTCPHDTGPPSPDQDLVPDPGFDRNVPARGAAWHNASGGTPDMGPGHVGLYLHSAVNTDHREYVHTRLKESLDPCGRYAVRMRVRRNAAYGHAVDRIGIALVEEFTMEHRRDVLPFTPAWSTAGGAVMDHTAEWTTLCGTIDAPGCARTLIIGNFHHDRATTIVQRDPRGGPFAYYFVDDVSLWRTGTVEGCTVQCPDTLDQPEMPAADSGAPAPDMIVMRFAVAHHAPRAGLADLCEQVLTALGRRPGAVVHVHGHTDATGSPQANHHLAERRAHTVAHALVRAGVPRRQVRLHVHGANMPAASNDTDEGRALNRRVEVRLGH